MIARSNLGSVGAWDGFSHAYVAEVPQILSPNPKCLYLSNASLTVSEVRAILCDMDLGLGISVNAVISKMFNKWTREGPSG